MLLLLTMPRLPPLLLILILTLLNVHADSSSNAPSKLSRSYALNSASASAATAFPAHATAAPNDVVSAASADALFGVALVNVVAAAALLQFAACGCHDVRLRGPRRQTTAPRPSAASPYRLRPSPCRGARILPGAAVASSPRGFLSS